jgi:hypothetical protein
MPLQVGPAEARVTVRGTVSNFVESAVEVAVMASDSAPDPEGVNVTGVPEVMFDVAKRVPAEVGVRERLTVLMKAPVPVTVGVQAAV